MGLWANAISILFEKHTHAKRFQILFAKQGRITLTGFVDKTSRLVRISLLIGAVNKRVLLFFSGKLFHKGNKKLFFPVFEYPEHI